jgi:potassium channel subfamily K, other eukaryote
VRVFDERVIILNHDDGVSVLSEAYSSRYKNAIATHASEKAVKRHRHRIRHRTRPYDAFSERTGHHFHSSIALPPTTLPPFTTSATNIDTQTQMSTLNIDPQGCARHKLEALPSKVLHFTKIFHEHVLYLLGPGKNDRDILKKMPIGLKHLLCEITEAKIGDDIQEYILQDERAKRVSVVLSCVVM